MRFRTLLELGRVSNLPTVWTNMAAGWLLGGGNFSAVPFIWAALGGSLLYLSGMAMNDACDAGWDRKNKGDRPIVKGQISRRTVWILAVLYGVGGIVAAVFGAGACPILVSGLAASIIAYNVIHKRWAGSTWLMGACRFFLYLVAASASTGGGNPSPESMIWGGALGLYVVGLTYIARGESTGAPLVRWPLVPLIAPAVCATAFVISGWSFWALLFCAGFLGWIARSLMILKGGGEGRIGRAVGFLLAGMVLIDALAVSSGWPYLSLALFCAAPILIYFQRLVAAT